MKTYQGMPHLWGNLMVAIDFETTGAYAGYHEIIQIAVVPLTGDLRPNKELRPFYHNIAPEFPERAQNEASIVHGLDLSDLMLNSPSSDRVADLLVEWFENLDLPSTKRLVPLAHNWPFEASFARAWLGDALFEHIFHFHPRDGMVLALAMNDRAVSRGERTPFKKVGLSWLSHYFKVANENPHDALCDAIAEAEVYRALLRHEVLA